MARIAINRIFTPCPEGEHIFRVYKVEYKEEFGKLTIGLVNAKGDTVTENYSLLLNDGSPNDKAYAAFAFFAKTALNDFDREEVDPVELVDRYIKATVSHTVVDSNKEDGKKVTFVNLGDKKPADGFDTEPVEKALTLGKEAPAVAPVVEPVQEAPVSPTAGFDLNALLHG